MGEEIQDPDLHVGHQPYPRSASAECETVHRGLLFPGEDQRHLREVFRGCRFRRAGHGGDRCSLPGGRKSVGGTGLCACEENLPQAPQTGARDLSVGLGLARHGHHRSSGARSGRAGDPSCAGTLLGDPEAPDDQSPGHRLRTASFRDAAGIGSRMRSVLASRLLVAAVASLIAALPAPADGQGAQPFYKGKQITMLIASGAGGGYDAYARTLARYLPKHIPGNPVIVPKNTPGAGGLIAANTLYNNAAPDGLTFAALTNGVAMDPLFGEKAGRFDAQKFNWLGSMGKLENICVTWQGSPITRIEQAKTREVAVSASGATGNSAIMPKIVNQFLGTKFKVIGGYTEGSGVTLALERGEVDGVCGLSYSTLKTMRPDWFRDNKLNVILQIGLHKLHDLPDVPNAIDLVPDAEAKKVLELILIRQEMGRPFALPPGLPADRLNVLRRAFDETLKDPAFIAEAAKLQMEIDPLTGSEIESLLKTAYSAPKGVVARAAVLAK